MIALSSWRKTSWALRVVVLLGGIAYLLITIAFLSGVAAGDYAERGHGYTAAWTCIFLAGTMYFLLGIPLLGSPGPRRGWRRWCLFLAMAFVTALFGFLTGSFVVFPFYALLGLLLVIEAVRGRPRLPEVE